MCLTDGSLIGGDLDHVVRVGFDQIVVLVDQCGPHSLGVILIDTEDDGFGQAICLLEIVSQVLGRGLGAVEESYHPLEIVGIIEFRRDFLAIEIQGPLLWGVPVGVGTQHHPADSIGSEIAVLDTLGKAVLVDGVAEVLVGVDGVVAARRRGHAELGCAGEVVENLTPGRLVSCTAAMALVDDDKIEVVRFVLAKDAVRVLASVGDGLVEGEVDVPAGLVFALDFPDRTVSEGGLELALHRIIHEELAVCKVEEAVTRLSTPRALPELPDNLHGDKGLAGSGGHGDEKALVSPGNGLDGTVDGDLLVVAGLLD